MGQGLYHRMDPPDITSHLYREARRQGQTDCRRIHCVVLRRWTCQKVQRMEAQETTRCQNIISRLGCPSRHAAPLGEPSLREAYRF